MIEYRIEPADRHAHLFAVELRVPRPASAQRLSLPVWIPGSYMVREFGRHVVQPRAFQRGVEVPLEQVDKTSWVARCSGAAALVLRYRVYAFDTSVRAAWLDARRGFFNGTSVFLRVEGREAEAQRLRVAGLPPGWDVATSMAPGAGRHAYVAADYDELVDHPVELGRFWRGAFTAGAVAHEFVVAGALPGFDGERLLADAKRICATQIAFWHGRGRPPFERYLFLLNAVDEGRGGLEHRSSTALIASRRDLPRRGVAEPGDGYESLLGLISHEYFHTWNVKRLKPREFAHLDYAAENYTRLLWFFEGFTSYYDDLLLRRAGLIDAPGYLKLLSKAAQGVAQTPGRRLQSVAQASFDAWVKYYRSDENTPNATVSYYAKGAQVALALDLTLRRGGRSNLDDVMRALWKRSRGGPIGEDDIADELERAAGRPLRRELDDWVHGTDDLPLGTLLAAFGVRSRSESAGLAAALGLRLSEGALTGVQVKSVLRGSAAERAGLAPGDELLAVDGWRIRRLDDAQGWLAPAAAFELLLSRDQRILSLRVEPPAEAASKLSWVLEPKPSAAALALRRAWLGA